MATKPIAYIDMIRERYSQLGYPVYQWFRADGPPAWSPLKKSLKNSKIGVLCTAGTYVKGQVAYFYKDDTSHRVIPSNTPVENLRFSHLTENYLPDTRRDANCAFPLEPLRKLAHEGFIGSLAENVFSCMGAVYSKRRVDEEVAPTIYEAFVKENVDLAYLVPL